MESVSSGDNGQDTDFAMDKNEGSEPTENGQIQESVSDQILTLPWIKRREVNLWKMDRYRKVFLVVITTDFAMDKKEGSEPTENGQIRESVFGGYGDNGLDMNQLGCYLDTETPCTHGHEKHVQEKDYFDTFQARKYDDWSFVWNERNIEDEVSLEAQSTDYFENISLSGFTDGKTDERIEIREDDTFVNGNNLRSNVWVGEEIVMRGRKRKLDVVEIDTPNKRCWITVEEEKTEKIVRIKDRKRKCCTVQWIDHVERFWTQTSHVDVFRELVTVLIHVNTTDR